MKKLLITLLLSSVVTFLFSQNSIIDSLQNILSKGENSSAEEFAIKTQIAKKYLLLSYDSCEHYINELSLKVDNIDSELELIDYYLTGGEYYYRVKKEVLRDSFYRKAGKLLDENLDKERRCILNYKIAEKLRIPDHDSSLVHLEKALVSSRKNGFRQLEGLCYYSRGIIYDYKGEYEKSFENYYKAIAIQEQQRNKNDLASTYISLAITYRSYSFNNEMDEESFEKVKVNLEKCFNLLNVSDNLADIARANTEMGVFFGIKNDFENSLKYLDIAEENALVLNSSNRLQSVYSSKGNLYAINGELKKAKKYYKKEEALLLKIGEESDMAGLYFNYGFLDEKLGDISSSISNYKYALELARKLGKTRMQESIIKNLSIVLSENNNYKEAYRFQKQRQKLRDSLRNEKSTQLISELEVKYETEKLEQDKIILQREQEITNVKNKRLWTGIAVFLCLFPFILWFAFKENKRKRSEMLLNDKLTQQNKIVEKANASLFQKNQEILHRAKNHLSMLSVFMKQEARRIDDPQAKTALLETENRLQAISMIDRKLNASQGVEIAINEYLDELTSYIKQTFPENGKGLSLKTKIDSIMVNPEEAVWIGLIVNELMTNSYKYAFANTTSPEIEISLAKGPANELKMVYRDNGSGLVKEVDGQSSKSFGQRLIHNFTEQMNGRINTQNDKGLVYNFQFNVPKLAG